VLGRLTAWRYIDVDEADGAMASCIDIGVEVSFEQVLVCRQLSRVSLSLCYIHLLPRIGKPFAVAVP
jgi:hypothetical protein